jgi:hypothetical protein
VEWRGGTWELKDKRNVGLRQWDHVRVEVTMVTQQELCLDFHCHITLAALASSHLFPEPLILDEPVWVVRLFSLIALRANPAVHAEL